MKPFFILWNPDWHEPPKLRWDSRKEAVEFAHQCAQRSPKARFFVLRAESLAEAKPIEVAVTTLSARVAKKAPKVKTSKRKR